jgi:hypothetical protein
VATLHRDLFAPQGKGARTPESFANARDPHKRLRLGLVTADFHHQHPVNIFMQPVLARWNPQDIEITVYFTGVSYDEQTLLAKRRVSHWVEVTTLNDVQLARRIEEDGIDVLLDLAGHTGMQRMAMFAQRAAPVQTPNPPEHADVSTRPEAPVQASSTRHVSTRTRPRNTAQPAELRGKSPCRWSSECARHAELPAQASTRPDCRPCPACAGPQRWRPPRGKPQPPWPHVR